MYCISPNPICLRLLWQLERRAFSRARPKTGNRIAASIEIMAITTSNSISVKARFELVRLRLRGRGVFCMMDSPSDLQARVWFPLFHYTRKVRFLNNGRKEVLESTRLSVGKGAFGTRSESLRAWQKCVAKDLRATQKEGRRRLRTALTDAAFRRSDPSGSSVEQRL